MKPHHKVLIAILVLFSPIAIMAVLVSPNEYADQGMLAIDCDGPISVMIFAAPCYFVYGVGLAVFAESFYQSRRILYLLICLVCIFILGAITVNVSSALSENNNLNHKEHCSGK